MRSLIFYLISFLLIPPGWVQGQTCTGGCLTNGTFAGGCADTPDGSCDEINPSCNAGWYISNGSPQFIANSGYSSTATCPNPVSAFMWSQYQSANGGVVGEGIYTNYDFTPGVTYTVQINFNVNVSYFSTQDGVNGAVNIYAAKGLTPGAVNVCGSVIPTSGISKALIGSYSITTATTSQDLTFTYSPASGTSFNQFWIYPQAVSAADAPDVGLSVTSVFVCPSDCNTSGTQDYNTGVLPQSAVYNDIYIGSSVGSGGSGTVTVTSTGTTTMAVGDAVYMEPQFNATVSGSGSFMAYIVPCNQQDAAVRNGYDSVRINSIDVLDSIMKNQTDLERPHHEFVAAPAVVSSSGSTSITAFPTVGKGTLNVTGSQEDLGGAMMTVVDESGRGLFKTLNGSNSTISLDLTSLANGLYFLRIQKGSSLTTFKFIIDK